MSGLWLYLQLTSLQLDAFQQANRSVVTCAAECRPEPSLLPELASAVALVADDALMIRQANVQARQQGVTPGMTLSMACAICSTLHILSYDDQQETALLHQLADQLYQFTADLALHPPTAQNPTAALWLRIDPMLQLYGGLTAYLAQLQQQLGIAGVHYQWALADSAAAARILCHSNPGWLQPQSDKISRQLATVALQHSSLSTSVILQLQAIGVHTLGQLRQLPVAELSRRFSRELVDYLAELAGSRSAKLQFYQPLIHFSQRLELLYLLERSAQLIAPLGYLLTQLEVFLQQRDQHCFQLQLTLFLQDQQRQQIQLHSAGGEYAQQRWLGLFEHKLASLQIAAPIFALQLQAVHTAPRQGENLTLFSEGLQQQSEHQSHGLQGSVQPVKLSHRTYLQPPTAVPRLLQQLIAREQGSAQHSIPASTDQSAADHLAPANTSAVERSPVARSPEERPPVEKGAPFTANKLDSTTVSAGQATAVARLISVLSARLGEHAWYIPVARSDFRPNIANSRQTITSRCHTGRSFSASPSAICLRPTLLLAEPIPLTMPLQLQPGVERIDTGWWDQQPQQRDYFIGRNSAGQWCWVFKEQQLWFLQGYFA